jgi:predicted 2-oxoglutarate/Fe(II)-dependent dioxygenase YbiX
MVSLAMNSVLSLRPGDRIPDFALPGLDGKHRKFIWSFTGAPVALVAVDDLANLDGGQFAALIDACAKATVVPVVVAGNAVAAAAAPWAKLAGTSQPPLLLCDPDHRFLPALLVQGGIGLGAGGALRMRVIVLDPNQRVAATFDSRALLGATEAMDELARSVRSDDGRDLLLTTPMAPVLVLPRVFEPDFCTQLVRLWGKGDHKDSGVSSRYGDVNMDHLKRTEDYTIVEPMMLKAVSDRLAYRIGPELTKVFAFDRQFTFDSHIVLSYSADGRHFFGAHRDNGAPTTADRAFAVSLNLNDDFEGGELVFPEYAGVRVSPPAGGAAVFSCSLLHQVLPVTRGRRFVLTTFFRAKA